MEARFHGHETDGGIYLIRNAANGRVYVGETSRFQKRQRGHLSYLRNRKHPNKPLQNDFNIDPKEFSFEVIALLPEKNSRKDAELIAIRLLYGEGCYNVMDSLTPSVLGRKDAEEMKLRKSKLSSLRRGWKHTEETKAKIAARLTGKKNHFGIRHSEETKGKIRAARLGSKASPETKAKMSASRVGVAKSEETRARLSASLRGHPGHVFSEEERAKMSRSQTGRKHTEETRLKMSLSARARRQTNIGVAHG